MREISEMFSPLKEKEVIDDSDVVRYQRNRELKEFFNNLIKEYLKKNNKSIAEITKKDINLLGKKYNDKEREVLIQQVMYYLETNFGKPLKWIKENNKCVLFQEIDSDGWINTWTEKASSESWKQWSVSTPTEDGKSDLWWNKEPDNSSSWELLSS